MYIGLWKLTCIGVTPSLSVAVGTMTSFLFIIMGEMLTVMNITEMYITFCRTFTITSVKMVRFPL